MQRDYLEAYLTLCSHSMVENYSRVLHLAEKHADFPLEVWRNRWAAVLSTCREILSLSTSTIQVTTSGRPNNLSVEMEISVDRGRLLLHSKNLQGMVQIRFYEINAERMFSSNVSHFSHVQKIVGGY